MIYLTLERHIMSKIDMSKYSFLVPEEGDTIENNLMFFWIECWDWWDVILTILFEQINDILKEDDEILFKIIQVKEKRWWLCINYYWGSDRIYNLITSVEQLSYHICETCWRIWENKEVNWWYRTICKECLANRK